MRRFSALFIPFVLAFLTALTACGGGNGTPVFGNPSTITVTPGSTSITPGTVENLNAVVQDNKGTTLFISGGAASSNVTFTSSNTNVIQVANNGLICAGKWDSLATPVVCTPFDANSNPPNGVGQSSITVKSGSVTSTAVNIIVHQPIGRIDITGAPADVASCISQGETAQLTATVQDTSGNPITSTVGPITLTPTVADIVSIDANQLATAGDPGQTQIVADVGTFRSTPVTFTVCPVTTISAHVKGATDTTVTLDNAATSTLTADLTDSKGKPVIISRASSTTPASLTWSTTTPSASVSFTTPVKTDVTSTTTNDATVTGSRAGSASIVASCTPPACNTGLTPAYSNVVTETTNGTSTSVVFVTGTDTTQLIPIPTGTNTPGTTITLSNQPNSLVIGKDGARALLGSSGGLMVVDANALTLTGTFTTVPGKVLAIAPNGSTAVVSDTTKGQVFVGDVTGNSFQVFPLPNVTAAAFSPDGFRLYLASPTSVTVITPGAAQKTIALAATDVTSSTSGAAAYFASGTVRMAEPSCKTTLPTTTFALSTVANTGTVTLVKALNGGTQVLAAGPGVLDAIDVTTDTAVCPPAITNTSNPLNITGTPNQIIAASDGSRAFITNDTANLITYTAATHTVGTLALSNTTASFTGGLTLDGNQLYVGVAGTTPIVHHIDLTANPPTDTPITASTTAFTPNLVAVRP